MSAQSPQKPRASTLHLPVPPAISPASSTDGNVSPLLPAFVPRPPIGRHSTSLSLSGPQGRLNFMMSQTTSANIPLAYTPKLLMPTVRAVRNANASSASRTSSTRFSPAKHPRSKTGSAAPSLHPSPDLSTLPAVFIDWIGGGCRFEVVEDQIELEGYQIYAVEKWVVDRSRPVTVLTVFTGDPSHKITVTALSPLSSLTQLEAQLEWDKAMHELRRDGARQKETDRGVIMVTSLASFRSDFTIVHIPGGNYLDIREQLYTNINVLRMGCSGRSALTLEEPSDTTKDRFISTYYIPDKSTIRSPVQFNTTVLELVRLMQAALSICGLFDLCREERNGLLCDATCAGVRLWVKEIGESCAGVEATERNADPMVVSALFSMILTTRNRLQAMGHWVPKDPFIDPISFVKALTSFNSARPHAHAHTLSLPHHFAGSNIAMSPFVSSAPVPPVQCVFLTRTLIDSINTAYDKAKQNESYKVHRVLINKLDDLATDLRTNPDPSNNGKGVFGWANNLNPVTDLGKFVKIITENSRDGSPSLKYLWTGRPTEVGKKRKEKEIVLSEGEDREREKEIEKEERERIERERERDRDIRSSEDEGDPMGGLPWSGRVQRKIESWAVLGKGKKLSADFGSRVKGSESPRHGPPLQPDSSLPSVIVSRDPCDDDDILTSGQVSPVSDTQPRNPFFLGVGNLPRADRSVGELSDYDKKVTEFNQRNPPARPYGQPRVVSWADPQTAREHLGEESDPRQRRGLSPSPLPTIHSSRETSVDAGDNSRTKRPTYHALKRWRSFDDNDALRGSRILPKDRMQIDVELCGQFLMMKRREEHMVNVIACLKALTTSLSASNTTLRQEHSFELPVIDALQARAGVLQDVEAARAHADAMTQETNALSYESAQFLINDLWHMATGPRQKVFAMRERVFGTGRRLPQGANGAHGRFNRVQWTMDGGTRLVDVHGRSESETEEEAGLPWIRPSYREEDEGDIMEHTTLKPTWLLRMFNYWGNRWGISRSSPTDKDKDDRQLEEPRDRAKSTSVSSPASGVELRSQLARTNTA